MNIEDKKNHLTEKQIWLLRMLFEELGNKSLNEALKQWEQQNGKIQRPTKDTPSNNGEQSIPAERGATERAPEPLPSRIKRKYRRNE